MSNRPETPQWIQFTILGAIVAVGLLAYNEYQERRHSPEAFFQAIAENAAEQIMQSQAQHPGLSADEQSALLLNRAVEEGQRNIQQVVDAEGLLYSADLTAYLQSLGPNWKSITVDQRAQLLSDAHIDLAKAPGTCQQRATHLALKEKGNVGNLSEWQLAVCQADGLEQ